MGTFRNYDKTLARVREVGSSPDPSIRAIRGHMAVGVRQWLPSDTQYVTILRRPVPRVISHYYHLKQRQRVTRVRPFGLPPMPAELTLHDCVDQAQYIPDNLATRLLSDSPSPLGELTAERVEAAKRNLREVFALVGVTERFDEFFVLALSLLDLPLATYR